MAYHVAAAAPGCGTMHGALCWCRRWGDVWPMPAACVRGCRRGLGRGLDRCPPLGAHIGAGRGGMVAIRWTAVQFVRKRQG